MLKLHDALKNLTKNKKNKKNFIDLKSTKTILMLKLKKTNIKFYFIFIQIILLLHLHKVYKPTSYSKFQIKSYLLAYFLLLLVF